MSKSVPRSQGPRRASEAIVHAELDRLDGLRGIDGEGRGWVDEISGEGHVRPVETVVVSLVGIYNIAPLKHLTIW